MTEIEKKKCRNGYVNKQTVFNTVYMQLIARVIGPLKCLLHSKLRIHL